MVGVVLTDRVVLEVEQIPGADSDAAFEFRTDLETTDTLDRKFVLSESGQYLREAHDILPDAVTDPISDAEFDRGEGYHIDGGARTDTKSITATRGVEEALQWGDGSATDGPTQTDVPMPAGDEPADIDAMIDVFNHWLNETRSDSGGQTWLHIRHHTDGSYSGEPGVFGEPIRVAVLEHTIEKEDETEIEISLECVRTAHLPDVQEALDGVEDAINDAVAELSDVTPDW